jgi:hypothetical protein
LAAGVNRLSLSGMCVLIHDQYDGASVGVNKRTGSDNTYIGDAVIVDALDIHGAVGVDADDSYIVSCDASVRATVNMSAPRCWDDAEEAWYVIFPFVLVVSVIQCILME